MLSPDVTLSGVSTVTVSTLVSACVTLKTVLRVENLRVYGSRFVGDSGLSVCNERTEC